MCDFITCYRCRKTNYIDEMVLTPGGRIYCSYCGYELINDQLAAKPTKN